MDWNADTSLSGRVPLRQPPGDLTLVVIADQLLAVAVIARPVEDDLLLLHVAAEEIILPARMTDAIVIMIDAIVIALEAQRIET